MYLFYVLFPVSRRDSFLVQHSTYFGKLQCILESLRTQQMPLIKRQNSSWMTCRTISVCLFATHYSSSRFDLLSFCDSIKFLAMSRWTPSSPALLILKLLSLFHGRFFFLYVGFMKDWKETAFSTSLVKRSSNGEIAFFKRYYIKIYTYELLRLLSGLC